MAGNMRGRELAEAVYKQVTQEPWTHDQQLITNGPDVAHGCGTQACIAGWTYLYAYDGPESDVLYATESEAHWAELAELFPEESSGMNMYDLPESALAADLLGIDRGTFLQRIFTEQDEQRAISNLKELAGL